MVESSHPVLLTCLWAMTGLGGCLACTSQPGSVQPGSLVKARVFDVMLAPNEIFTSKTGFQAPLQISREPRKQAILPMRNEPWCSCGGFWGPLFPCVPPRSTCEQDLLRACLGMCPLLALSCLEQDVGPLGDD